jgi:hypothetical protein
MRAGRLIAHGPVRELVDEHGSLEQAYLELVGEPAPGERPLEHGAPVVAGATRR